VIVGSRFLRLTITLTTPLAAPAAPARAGQTAPTQPTTPTSPDPEADQTTAVPVLVGGDPIVWITVGAGPYTPQYRADRIADRLHTIVRDRSISDPTVTVTEKDASSELRVGPRLLMVVTAQDARSLGAARPAVAAQYAREFESAIRSERLRYAPATLMRSGRYGVVATLVLLASVWLLLRITRRIQRSIGRRWLHHGSLRFRMRKSCLASGSATRSIWSSASSVRLRSCCSSPVSHLHARALPLDPRGFEGAGWLRHHAVPWRNSGSGIRDPESGPGSGIRDPGSGIR